MIKKAQLTDSVKKGNFIINSRKKHEACMIKHTSNGMIKEMEFDKVVIHYKSGWIFKGFTKDFSPDKGSFRYFFLPDKPSSDATNVFIKDLKAVFFVRDLIGDPLYKERKEYLEGEEPTGQKVEVIFEDGEVLVGSTLDCDPKRQGFFFTPADPKSNNIKIFAVASALKQIRFL
jgi:hypothetical protein